MTAPPEFPIMFNGNGIETATEGENVEDTYFRIIIESDWFNEQNPDDREAFLLVIATKCIDWALCRRDF